MLTRKEAFKMAMDIDGHMNDNPHGIDLSWDSIEKLVNEAYAKGAAAEREACANVCEDIEPVTYRFGGETHDDAGRTAYACATAIRARREQ